MMTPAIEDLYKNAAAGRGLWAGLFPSKQPTLPPAWTLRHRRDLTLPPPEEPAHVTLAHFGRKVQPSTVERVLIACSRTMEVNGVGIKHATPWAVARMDQSKGSVIAILLEGDGLHQFRGHLVNQVQRIGLRVDATFAFHPHLTIARLATNAEASIPRFGRGEQLLFPELTIVCGEARVVMSFGETPF